MALKKKIDLEGGIAAEYHRISSGWFGPSGNCGAVVYSYTSEQWRNTEKDRMSKSAEEIEQSNTAKTAQCYVMLQEYTFTCDPINDAINLSYLYEKLKQTEAFEGAEDC
jgi:hypothetical protein